MDMFKTIISQFEESKKMRSIDSSDEDSLVVIRDK